MQQLDEPDTRTLETKLAVFFAQMWGMFLYGGTIDESNLQGALDKSGLCFWHEATTEEISSDELDCDPGDALLRLNSDGERAAYIASTKGKR